ncbi:phospholipase B-like 1 [Diadema antillarum]|uniref:phospholipase B-like 1 n=1 Tax=Diadema antillarum TaxID=105358 RepID=UPI003A8BB85E
MITMASQSWCQRSPVMLIICVLSWTLLMKGAEAEIVSGTVYMQDGTFKVKLGVIDKTGVAYGTYNNTLMTTGWGELHLFAGYSQGNKLLSDHDTMFAAGMLEGALTAKEISANIQNINSTMFRSDGDPELWARVVTFFEQQDVWMRQMMAERMKDDPFWEGVALVVAQFDGLIEGYKGNTNRVANKSRDYFLAMQVLNACGDLLDLTKAVMPSLMPDFDKVTKQEFYRYVASSGHCSALVKVLPGFEDVFMSHSSWFTYSATLRIYKHYHFKLSFQHNAAEVTSFSSYPGFLESLDDFYIMSSGLSMLQTTNNVFNSTLYTFVQPQSLFAWHRVRVANMMARSGKEWAEIVARYNSGTYNNQYMIIDRTKIVPKTTILDDALWVVEQVPTLVVSGDQTNILRAGYWPSYNVPFYEQIFNISGYPAMVEKQGPDTSYQLAPRAKIFRRDQGKVVDMNSMKKIMRFNEYKTDPYSEGDPSKSICMRGDLMTKPVPDGCYDTKVANLWMAAEQTSYVINGPTRAEGSLPPFKWVSPFTRYSHEGLPQEYDFDFVTMKPKDL